jgi:hypothetical protein
MKAHVVFGLALALLGGAAADALACGGFFCDSGGTPVDQSGEKILFVVDQSGVEVHVQISYTGTDAQFAWVVPTRQVPTLGVGIDQMFSVVTQQTAPQFSVNWHFPNNCGGSGGFGGGTGGSGGGGQDAASADGAVPDGGVTVVSSDVVGPYDSVVLASDDPQALKTWLQTNGYYLSPAGSALIDPYVQEHNYFVALKLHAGRSVSDIQPIVLRFAGGEPCVPLRLTAVAALNDMEVHAYLLGNARAVPTNFYEVRPDLARIDWLGRGANYNQVVSYAANEASGNAFVTEYAGPSSIMSGLLYRPGQFNLAALQAITDPARYFEALPVARTGQVLNVFRRWFPEPQALVNQGVPDAQFYNCLDCYRSYWQGQAFDPVGMTNDLDTLIFQPLQHAQSLFDRFPYLTRLYTRISPPEMTRDPTFTFNPDMPPVSNVHVAEGYLSCNLQNGPIELVLPDGRTLWLNGAGDRGDFDSLPAAESWWQLGSSGSGMQVGSNTDLINRRVAEHNSRVPHSGFPYPSPPMPWGGANPPFDSGGGCAATPPGAAGIVGTTLGGFVLAGVLLRRRRRR